LKNAKKKKKKIRLFGTPIISRDLRDPRTIIFIRQIWAILSQSNFNKRIFLSIRPSQLTLLLLRKESGNSILSIISPAIKCDSMQAA
jgi:hypothetical protein